MSEDQKSLQTKLTVTNSQIQGVARYGVFIHGNNKCNVNFDNVDISGCGEDGIHLGAPSSNPLRDFGLEDLDQEALQKLLVALKNQKLPVNETSLCDEYSALLKILARGKNVVEVAHKIMVLCNSPAFHSTVAWFQNHMGV